EGLAGAGRSEHPEVVAARGADLQGRPGHRLADHAGPVHRASHAGRHADGRGLPRTPTPPACGPSLRCEPAAPVPKTRTSVRPRPRPPVGTAGMPGHPRPRTPVGTTRTSRFPEAPAWVARRGGAWIRGWARWELARA